jgi:hypothetical protein
MGGFVDVITVGTPSSQCALMTSNALGGVFGSAFTERKYAASWASSSLSPKPSSTKGHGPPP